MTISCSLPLFNKHEQYDVLSYDDFAKKIDNGDIIIRPFNDDMRNLDSRTLWGGWIFLRQDVGIVFKDNSSNCKIFGIVEHCNSCQKKYGCKSRELHYFLKYESILREKSPFILRKLIITDSIKKKLVDSLRCYLIEKDSFTVCFNGIPPKSFSTVGWVLQKNKILSDTQNVRTLWSAHYLEKDKMKEYAWDNKGKIYWKQVPKLKFSDSSIYLSPEIHFNPFVRNDSLLFKVYRKPLPME